MIHTYIEVRNIKDTLVIPFKACRGTTLRGGSGGWSEYIKYNSNMEQIICTHEVLRQPNNRNYKQRLILPLKGGHPTFGQVTTVGLAWSLLGSHLELNICGTRGGGWWDAIAFHQCDMYMNFEGYIQS